MSVRTLIVVDLDNPQQGIDALVEAGVLLREPNYSSDPSVRVKYSVVQPHKHEWRVWMTQGQGIYPGVALHCADESCPASRTVPNRLPIEVPG